MDKFLHALFLLPDWLAWVIFLLENLVLTFMVLYAGRLIPGRVIYTRREWLICGVTNVLNTVVTFAGFWLWKHGFIEIGTGFSWRIVPDFLQQGVMRWLGSSTFHHDHHRDVEHNFGFYTTVWDRVFGTLK